MSNYDPTDLRRHELQKAEALAAKRHAQKSEDDDFKWLMTSKRGRRIVWRLLDQAGVFRNSFTPDAYQTAFNEGWRNYGLKTLHQIHALCPELYPTLMKENVDVRSDSNTGDAGNAD